MMPAGSPGPMVPTLQKPSLLQMHFHRLPKHIFARFQRTALLSTRGHHLTAALDGRHLSTSDLVRNEIQKLSALDTPQAQML